ncbi:MAG: phosphate ABC transporter substrate-binding protein [Methylacidiphilales bacterium]|nr:phosphate ABC transporter substrate-binding protein [Candidatus Methylacidiphilales bacterium]
MKKAIEVEQQLSQLDAEIKDLVKIITAKPEKNSSPILFLIPLALILAGGIYLAFFQPKTQTSFQTNCLPSGTKLRINGATSMAQINAKFKDLIGAKCAGTSLEITANGTDVGIEQLIAGKVDIAAVSRPLTAAEQAQGLVGTFVKADAIAIMVSKENPFQLGLTTSQLADIFKGNISNWSAVGGQPGTIRVINRSPLSGTHDAFQELILKNAQFGTNSNIKTYPTDETTPIIQKLKADGISYASYAQAKEQKSINIVPIDGLKPDSPQYPHKRQLFYVYKQPITPMVKSFLDFLNSSDGQEAIN